MVAFSAQPFLPFVKSCIAVLSLSILAIDSRITPRKVLCGAVGNKVSSMGTFVPDRSDNLQRHLQKQRISSEHASLFFLALSELRKTSGEEEMKEDSIIGKQD